MARPPAHEDRLGLLQGTLDMLILQTLLQGPAHGHQIATTIERTSNDALLVDHGSLYPALPPLAEARLDHRRVGHIGEQPAGEVLRPDARRSPAARTGGDPAGSGWSRRSGASCGPPTRVGGRDDVAGSGCAAWCPIWAAVRPTRISRRSSDSTWTWRRERQREAGAVDSDARRAARRTLGNAALIRERTRDVWGWRWLDDLGGDLRHAGRGLRHPEPERIVSVRGLTNVTFPALRDDTRTFEHLAAYGSPRRFTWRGPSGSHALRGWEVSPSFFSGVYGVAPHLGRFFTEDEAVAGAHRVVVLNFPRLEGPLRVGSGRDRDATRTGRCAACRGRRPAAALLRAGSGHGGLDAVGRRSLRADESGRPVHDDQDDHADVRSR